MHAVREGHWLVLDELNLAPSEVLEALNRLLDDNRQLWLPETQTLLTAHPHFALFATQNPPGLYGGRKLLSRAFRNRFVELHVDDIPEGELAEILHRRCAIPHKWAQHLIAVMKGPPWPPFLLSPLIGLRSATRPLWLPRLRGEVWPHYPS